MFNNRYVMNYEPLATGTSLEYSQPRTFGVRVGFKY